MKSIFCILSVIHISFHQCLSQKIISTASIQYTSIQYSAENFKWAYGTNIGFAYDWKRNSIGLIGNLSFSRYDGFIEREKSRLIGLKAFYCYKIYQRERFSFQAGPLIGFQWMGVIKGISSDKPMIGALFNPSINNFIFKNLSIEFIIEPKYFMSLGQTLDAYAPYDLKIGMIDFQVGLSYLLKK